MGTAVESKKPVLSKRQQKKQAQRARQKEKRRIEKEAQKKEKEQKDKEILDLEDLGTVTGAAAGAEKRDKALGGTNEEESEEEAQDEEKGTGPPKEMLNDRLRRNLTKQGYKLIGSHSGVKLCRWTKAMLRGRGGCYKHTMYGISSFQCMEMTPSLACANKVVKTSVIYSAQVPYL